MDAVHPEDRGRVAGAVRNRSQNETGPPGEVEFRIVRPDGQERWVRSRTFPVQDSEGRSGRLVGISQDITREKLAELRLTKLYEVLEDRICERTEQLAQSEQRWRSLVSTAPDLVLVLGPDCVIRYINRALAGFTVEGVVGTSAYDYLDPAYRQVMRQSVERVLATGEFDRFECIGKGAEDSSAWYSTRVGPYRENGRVVGVTLIVTDISQQKAVEKELSTEKELLRALLDLQERERKMIAHEIHDGFVQDVVGAHMNLSAACHRLTRQGQAAKSVDATLKLLKKSIDEARRLISELRPMIIDEEGIVDAIEYLVAESLPELKLRFTHDVNFHRLDSMLEGTLFRIVQEAINNIKRHAGVKEAEVRLVQRDGIVRAEVRDMGVGFDLAAVPAARFGLRGIHERARLFGGFARVETAPGHGTCVIAELPLLVDDPFNRG
jgi:PAS domain S-box-containing protein